MKLTSTGCLNKIQLCDLSFTCRWLSGLWSSGTCWIHLHPEERVSRFLASSVTYQKNYVASHPKRLQASEFVCIEHLTNIFILVYIYIYIKVKQSCYRPGVAQRVPGS